jgi:phenylacetic acid degradation operon negative regulatory protein
MAKKQNTLVNDILGFLGGLTDFLPRPLETPYQMVRRIRRLQYKEYYNAVYQLKKRGVVKIEKKDGKNFVVLTRKGVLETLLIKANIQKQKNWDGKWRLIIFDIPIAANLERDRLRGLLKRYGFKKLQASVFINPFPLNREAVDYLGQTGLDKFIRLLKVEEMDNDADLKKHFGL